MAVVLGHVVTRLATQKLAAYYKRPAERLAEQKMLEREEAKASRGVFANRKARRRWAAKNRKA